MQIALMKTAEALKPGQAIKIPREKMVRAAEGMLDSLIFDSVRESDIKEFARLAELNWGVKMQEDPIRGDYTMFKLTA